MDDLEREAESAIAEIGMGDGEIAWGQPGRQLDADAGKLQCVGGAVTGQRCVSDRDARDLAAFLYTRT